MDWYHWPRANSFCSESPWLGRLCVQGKAEHNKKNKKKIFLQSITFPFCFSKPLESLPLLYIYNYILVWEFLSHLISTQHLLLNFTRSDHYHRSISLDLTQRKSFYLLPTSIQQKSPLLTLQRTNFPSLFTSHNVLFFFFFSYFFLYRSCRSIFSITVHLFLSGSFRRHR